MEPFISRIRIRIISSLKNIRYIHPFKKTLIALTVIYLLFFTINTDKEMLIRLPSLFSSGNLEILKNMDLIISKDPLKFHFIDCGQGDAILIKAYDKFILIDTGPPDEHQKVRKYISYITDRIDILIITHDHDDHTGNLKEILDSFKVDKLILPVKDSSGMTDFCSKYAIVSHGTEIVPGRTGLTFRIENIDITCLHPESPIYEDENNNSGVYLLTLHDRGYLFTGDADERIIGKVLKEIKVPIALFKAGHHGSKSSYKDNMSGYLDTSLTVISCGFRNMFGHPSKEVISSLETEGISYIRTDIHGTSVVTSDGKRLRSAIFTDLNR